VIDRGPNSPDHPIADHPIVYNLNRRNNQVVIPQDLVLYEEEFQKIKQALQRLFQDASALLVFLVDKNGQQIAAVGDMNSVDTTSLASLTAGNVAATDGLARLIGEKEFSILFHEGEKDNIHISIVARRVILVVIFDERASLGLVRLRVRRTTAELEAVFEEIASKIESEKLTLAAELDAPFSEITDDDIDRLFSE
jgi:predicted regulator of Ras-like GTPase activity (Roadblock/LC7/MglB family)